MLYHGGAQSQTTITEVTVQKAYHEDTKGTKNILWVRVLRDFVMKKFPCPPFVSVHSVVALLVLRGSA
jgi:hypothetical protein